MEGIVIVLYKVLLLAGVFSSAYAGYAAYRLNPKGKANRIFLMAAVAVMFWNLDAFLRGMGFGADISELLIRSQISMGIIAGAGLLWLMQVFSKSEVPKPIAALPAAALVLLVVFTDTIISGDAPQWYSYVGVEGPLIWIMQAYLVAAIAASLAMARITWTQLGKRGRAYFMDISLIVFPVAILALIDGIIFTAGIPFPTLSNAAVGPADLFAFYVFRKHSGEKARRGEKATDGNGPVMAFFCAV